jgi:hypothetical protein
MAKVVGQVIGGEERILDGMTTVADVKRELGVPSYTLWSMATLPLTASA